MDDVAVLNPINIEAAYVWREQFPAIGKAISIREVAR